MKIHIMKLRHNSHNGQWFGTVNFLNMLALEWQIHSSCYRAQENIMIQNECGLKMKMVIDREKSNKHRINSQSHCASLWTFSLNYLWNGSYIFCDRVKWNFMSWNQYGLKFKMVIGIIKSYETDSIPSVQHAAQGYLVTKVPFCRDFIMTVTCS
jgi:hypothetical protein